MKTYIFNFLSWSTILFRVLKEIKYSMSSLGVITYKHLSNDEQSGVGSIKGYPTKC